MELKMERIQMELRKGCARTQVTFDEVYNLPDYLPDFFSVILNRGDIRVDESKAGMGTVNVRGAVRFQVLYRTDQNEWKISSLEGEFPFQETLNLEQVEEFDLTRVEAVLEDLSIQMINSRKLNIRALLELKVCAFERGDVEIPVAPEAEETLQMQKKERETLQLIYRGKEKCHIREEFKIPSNKPNIRQLLWQQAQVLSTESRVSAGAVTLQGDIQILLIYVGQEDDRLQWLETRAAYHCEYQIPEADSKAVPYIAAKAENVRCTVNPDEDGEDRVILVEGDLKADIWLYEEKKMSYLQDMYALDRRIVLKRQPLSLAQLHMKNESRCRVTDTLEIHNRDQDILQICAGFGVVELDRREVTPQGLEVEGAVKVQVLYLTSSDTMPVEAAEGILPFQYTIAVDDLRKDDQMDLDYALEQISFLMKSSREIGVQATVALQAMIIRHEDCSMIREAEEQPICLEELNLQPGIVGLTLQNEDALWDVAKNYHTTVEDILEVNDLEADRVLPGTKILVIKKLPMRV